MRLGTPLPKTRAKPPTPEEIEVVVRNWRQNNSANYRNLLIALSVELIEDEESDWYWSQAERVYTNKSSDTVSASKAGVLLTALLVGRSLSDAKTAGLMGYGQLAEGLKNGSLTLADWTDGMRNLVRLSQETGILVANGGVEFVTQSDWSYMVTQIEKQYEYLDKFAADIAENPEKWLNGRLDNRMRLYQESAYSAYQNDLRREARIGGMDEERRVIGVSDHCEDCLDYAAMGWQPIGTLPEIGDSQCSQNCHCEFEYRKAGEVENGE